MNEGVKYLLFKAKKEKLSKIKISGKSKEENVSLINKIQYFKVSNMNYKNESLKINFV